MLKTNPESRKAESGKQNPKRPGAVFFPIPTFQKHIFEFCHAGF
jgi:hypothetical protein